MSLFLRNINVLIQTFLGSPLPTQKQAAKISPPTPVKFPACTPEAKKSAASRKDDAEVLVPLLQSIQRQTDVQMSHFEALGVHVTSNASHRDILPDPTFLPPFKDWRAISEEDLSLATTASKTALSNGMLSPGVQTYQERRKELSIDNTAAFRTVRRIPPPFAEPAVRLGNAYEFFKNLEILSGYWDDTTLPSGNGLEEKENTGPKEKISPKDVPPQFQLHKRIGNGSELPPEYRQHLLMAFVKLVAYDFGCSVNYARCEPRLMLTPSTPSKPASYFNSSATFVYRMPTDRSAARSGILEGPVATISCRATTIFSTPAEECIDFAREIVAILLTAQQRRREIQAETQFGVGKWWTQNPRWGGGTGGPIGREGDKDIAKVPSPTAVVPERLSTPTETDPVSLDAAKIGDINRAARGPQVKKIRKNGKTNHERICEIYRKMLPPTSSWDRKMKYMSIGRAKGAAHDDIFLVSALNHHVSVMRARVPLALLEVLDGGKTEWDGVKVWRSQWYDLFKAEERIEAMELVWGMMAYMTRAEEGT
ncbi:hypothetical protein BJ878DRAFT_118175 [Calycina marina]|uniref:Uncharacterized protein n=1 Tax=Calycina marina TaxID=1763456 RepID=A0A9P7Z195_9HELO|nr:hypothetical protein BJ878DRAFT_118175 [Calycina marina]